MSWAKTSASRRRLDTAVAMWQVVTSHVRMRTRCSDDGTSEKRRRSIPSANSNRISRELADASRNRNADLVVRDALDLCRH